MLSVRKRVIGNLEKCYSIAPLRYRGRDHILVAAEKTAPCVLFDMEGKKEDTVWTEPGGAMTMLQVPGSNGVFLATHKFYSPNDAADAGIVVVTPKTEGGWEVKTLVKLPFVHRFDILERSGIRYLIACTIKSGHEYKDDWRSPGKVYAAVLPEDVSVFSEEYPLKLHVIKDGLRKNHGYYRTMEGTIPTALISAEQGVFQFTPPAKAGERWTVRQLTKEPASDGVLLDFDGDGERELAVISRFHGDRIIFYKETEGRWQPVFEYEGTEFAHAIFAGDICGIPTLLIGHRKGTRRLLAFTWNRVTKQYEAQSLDQDCGPANVFHFCRDGKDFVLSANRETDEVALYELELRESGGYAGRTEERSI